MKVGRRAFLTAMTSTGLAITTPQLAKAVDGCEAVWTKRLTGPGTRAARRWGMVGTELGVPFITNDDEVSYLFGDTFGAVSPEAGRDWRSVVLLRSTNPPGSASGIVFDRAAGVHAAGQAPGLIHNGCRGLGIDGIWEETVLPTDGVDLAEVGKQVVSYVSVRRPGTTNYAGLAVSDNGQDFTRTQLKWWNDAGQGDALQFWTMQREGVWVYIFSVPAGRRHGGMILRRVRCDRMLSPDDYLGWNGRTWVPGRPITSILTGRFGEPSVRRLADGTWVMSYLNGVTGSVVTRTASRPEGRWSEEKVQIAQAGKSGLYGGFVHPWSSSRPGGLHLIVSMRRRVAGRTTAYHVSQYTGTV